MKHIKLFENFNESKPIDSFLQESTFDNLPINFKKGLLTYMYEGEPVEWSIDVSITDWVNDDNVNILIDDYSRVKGNSLFDYGYVPIELVINKITEWVKREGDYNSFEEYHTIYQSTNDVEYNDSLFPIIVNDDNEEYIEDGWHRFHHYLNKGYSEIPVIKLIVFLNK